MQHDILPQYIFNSRYARHSAEKKRRLTFEESVVQMMDMHRRKVMVEGAEGTLKALDDVEQAILDGRLLGSQRALQYGGEPMERHHEKGYNCTFSLCDRPEFFNQGFFLLLCGAGVGFSVQTQHVAQLPFVLGPNIQLPVYTHVIQDSIEGWADALAALMDSYFFNRPEVEFDDSQVRPYGSKISSGVGRAPGPEPLMKALREVREILDRTVGSSLRPIDAYDIFMHLADSVVSGGVRRSATLALCSIDDQDMLDAKTGLWFDENPQRARSNNSVVALRGHLTKEQLQMILAPSQESMGDLGIYLTSDLDSGINPCAEIWFKPILELAQGHEVTGWSFCNLCEINAAKIHSLEDALEVAHLASVLGTVQASYTDFPYLGPVSEAIAIRDSLLGVSITGIMDNPEIMSEYTLQVMARQVVCTNQIIADELGIPHAARTTCVKPAGKTSLLFQTSSGISARKGQRTLQRVQGDSIEPPAEFLNEQIRAHGEFADDMVERGVWGTEFCFSFPMDAPEGAVMEDELSAIDQLNNVKFMKDYWINPGHVWGEETHNVSNTLFVDDGEWRDVLEFLWENQDSFNCLSFQRGSSSLEYPQAPSVPVDTWNELVVQYGPDWPEVIIQRWQDRPEKQSVFAFKHEWSEGDPDVDEMHHRVALYCIFENLKSSDLHVDFSKLVEEEDNTQLAALVACGGGQCDI